MKKIILIILSIFILAFFTSCTIDNIDTDKKIMSPRNSIPPISGEWKIEKYKINDSTNFSEKKAKKLLGQSAFFHEKIVALGDILCINPSYKIKNVNSTDYLLYHYKIKDPNYLGIKNKKIQIITISSKEQFFYEFIKDGKKILVNIDGTFFYLKKVSDKVNNKKINKFLEKRNNLAELDNIKDNEILRSGVLLGLRSYDKNNSFEVDKQWQYRTLWISSENKVLDKVYETKDLFVPRKTGFWKIEVDRQIVDGELKDVLYAYPYTKKKNKLQLEENKANQGNNKHNILKTILFVGNDYISTESIEIASKPRKKLQVFPVDNVETGNPIKIFDIAGEGGRDALYKGAAKYFSNNPKYRSKYINMNPKEESFGIFRRNGHWIMKGRVNFSVNNENYFGDFNIQYIPPRQILNYDELCISWNAIKLRVPEAVDAYTSPNEDIAIIITNNNILIYTIEDNELSKKPLEKIKLKNEEKVVMSEWALGRYIYMWKDKFLENETNEVNN